MKNEKLTTDIEVYICNHKREDGECCFDLGAKILTDNLKIWAKNNSNQQIKVYRSGCLSKCSEGIAMSCYPERTMHLKIKQSDEEEIKQGLLRTLQKIKI